jgi:hypothetical protein
MRSNKKRRPTDAPRAAEQPRALHTNQPEKTFFIKAYVEVLWAQRHRHYARDLYTAVELAQRTGFSPVHLARELHRVGAQPVPRANCRKRKGYYHKPMPQLWWLSDYPIPEYLSTAPLAWEEYMLQKDSEQIARDAWNDYMLSAKIARELLRQVP